MMRSVLPAVLAAAMLVPSAADAAPELLAREAAPFTADARGRVVAWSSFDPASHMYRLKLLRDGVVTAPAIAPQGRPFDVDLGRAPGGGVGAVYSRCADDTRLRGCDVYLLDVADGV